MALARYILLIGGGLLLRSLVKLISVEPGYRAANVLTFQVALPATRYTPDRIRAFTEDLTARLRATPGVEAAAYAQQLPLVGLSENASFRRTPERPARFVAGTPELRPRQPGLPLRYGHAHRPGSGLGRG